MWFEIRSDPPPRGEMFIWTYFEPIDRSWKIGLAYWTVSGTWADAYGAPPRRATHWTKLPPPPKENR